MKIETEETEDKDVKMLDTWAHHKKHTTMEFVRNLVYHKNDLIVERSLASDGHSDLHYEFVSLHCPQCGKSCKNSKTLLDHIVFLHRESEIYMYELTGMVSFEVRNILALALSRQMEQSYIERKIEKKKLKLKCSLASPLASFLSIKQVKVSLNNQKKERSRHEKFSIVRLDITRCSENYTLEFDFTAREAMFQRIQEKMKEKEEKENIKSKEVQEQTQREELMWQDMVLKIKQEDEESQNILDYCSKEKSFDNVLCPVQNVTVCYAPTIASI